MIQSTVSAHDASSTIVKRVKTRDAVPSDQTVSIQGWVRTVRKQKTLAFVEVNDGSSLSGIQCVLVFDTINDATRDGTTEVKKITYIFCPTITHYLLFNLSH
jgi:aspartyl/asparaginyl-tRNA synthetase